MFIQRLRNAHRDAAGSQTSGHLCAKPSKKCEEHLSCVNILRSGIVVVVLYLQMNPDPGISLPARSEVECESPQREEEEDDRVPCSGLMRWLFLHKLRTWGRFTPATRATCCQRIRVLVPPQDRPDWWEVPRGGVACCGLTNISSAHARTHTHTHTQSRHSQCV